AGSAGGVVGVIEVRAAHRDVPWRGGKAVDLEAVNRLLLGISVFATSRTVVPSGDKNCLSLRGGLFPQRRQDQIVGGSNKALTLIETHAQHVRLIVFNGTPCSQNQREIQRVRDRIP